MKYLAIDASTEACSVALYLNDTFTNKFELCPQSHSLRLLPMIDELLAAEQITLAELDGLVFGQGPGSFTGVRIGIGVAQGLGFAADLPMVGISTLAAMARQAFDTSAAKTVIAAIDARMNEVYLCIYQKDEQENLRALIDECVIPPHQLGDILQKLNITQAAGVGTGWKAYADTFTQLQCDISETEIEYPCAMAMMALALPEFIAGNTVNAENAQPVYVRDTVSWQKLPGR